MSRAGPTQEALLELEKLRSAGSESGRSRASIAARSQGEFRTLTVSGEISLARLSVSTVAGGNASIDLVGAIVQRGPVEVR